MENVTDKTLDTILQLISRDVDIIKARLDEGNLQLDEKTAQTLCRYASSLSGIKENKGKEEKKAKEDLNRLSTEELMKLLKDEMTKEESNE